MSLNMALGSFFLGIFLLLITLQQVSSQTPSLEQQPVYVSGKPCLQNCIYYMAQAIGCQYNDQCICAGYMQSQATQYLSGCISTSCTYAQDVSTGVSFYESYCQGKQGTDVPLVTPVATEAEIITTDINTEYVSATETMTNTVYITQTAEEETTFTSYTATLTTKIPSYLTKVVYMTTTTVLNGTSLEELAYEWTSENEHGLDKGEKIAIAVGSVCGAVILLMAWVIWTYAEKLRRFNSYAARQQAPIGGNAGWGNRHVI